MESKVFKNNRTRLAKEIKDGLVILYSGQKKKVSTQEVYDFRPNKMFYYLTGLSHPDLVLILKVEQSQEKAYLFIPEPDALKEKWEGKQLNKNTTAEISAVEHVYYTSELGSKWNWLKNQHETFTLYANLCDRQLPELNETFHLSLDNDQMSCIHPTLTNLRSIKAEDEVNQVKKASQLAATGFEAVMRQAKPGMYEYEVEAIHDYMMKSQGLKPGQYKTILASGKHATILHYLDNDSLIGDNDLILMDIDVELGAYHCDLTRVFPANGQFTVRQREIYHAVLHVQKQVIAHIKPGMTYGELNELARGYLKQACQQLNLFTSKNDLGDYYFHNIGHPIGLDTHDVGSMTEDTVLQAGMLLTIEPGIYIAEESIGVRIEDIVVLRANGAENITGHLLKDADDIERIMKEGH